MTLEQKAKAHPFVDSIELDELGYWVTLKNGYCVPSGQSGFFAYTFKTILENLTYFTTTKKEWFLNAKLEQVRDNWDANPFLERLLYLMNHLELTQTESEVLAKLDFEKLKDKLTNTKK
jgi:hypothetical protein